MKFHCSSFEALMSTTASNRRKVKVHTLRDKVVQHLRIDNPVDRVEYKHAASNKATFEFINEQIIPGRLVFPAILVLVRGFRSVYTNRQQHVNNARKLAEFSDLPILPLFMMPIHRALNALGMTLPFGGRTT